ncbi:MAG: LysE family translocator [Rhizobiales bacterium]|nr:LysE family translocator [Hyphomicrobiales bacterium]NRB13858.1 LysE family translocator [Hyphomicrobiales bacterium]
MEYSSLIFGYAFYVLATVGTPGPNNIMLASSGANFGFKRSIPHALGVNLGFVFMLVMVGLGLGQIFVTYPIIHDIMRFVGAAFLLYLAFKIATSKSKSATGKSTSSPLTFIQAAAFQWVNPKAWVMIIGAIATFISIGGDKFTELGIMVLVNFCVGLPLIFAWCLFGREIGRFLKSERAFLIFNYIMASLLAISVLTLFW